MKKLLVVPLALVTFSFVPTTTAHAWTTPTGTCVGNFSLQTLDPTDPSYEPGAPAHRDRNGDGWLCANGHAWTDNRH